MLQVYTHTWLNVNIHFCNKKSALMQLHKLKENINVWGKSLWHDSLFFLLWRSEFSLWLVSYVSYWLLRIFFYLMQINVYAGLIPLFRGHGKGASVWVHAQLCLGTEDKEDTVSSPCCFLDLLCNPHHTQCFLWTSLPPFISSSLLFWVRKSMEIWLKYLVLV